ncbi:MAG: primosomal protein N', partial [Gammaproteobacteria bacterium]|nr:primosomal protein N' [Gammaproteobacteria bacterium]
DEEHDGSFKQQDGFRYSARDLAVWRARQLDVPVVLGSAMPALESLHNALEGRYRHLSLPERPGNARQPDFHVVDLRVYPPTDGLSQPLLNAMRQHLRGGDQALVYLNRRGFAPVLMCPGCGSIEECARCDARLVLHQGRQKLVCHHCGAERSAVPVCPDCQRERVAIGQGTERLEAALQHAFPEHPLVRIDRDSTRRRGDLERKLAQVRAGTASILVGTQMLTKGHDFPNVTCVAIVDADQGLFGTYFRSSERMAQSILQVAGRAGRADKPGEVWLQSWQPEHALLQTLIHRGYGEFARAALAERRAAGWPPYAHLALLRAEHPRREPLFRFLEAARAGAAPLLREPLRILGPASAPMEKRAGRYRGQLLIAAPDRKTLQQFLAGWRRRVEDQEDARKTRWSLDIDPFDLF